MKICRFLCFSIILLAGCRSNKPLNFQSDNLIIKQLSPHTFQHITYLNTESFGRVACNGMIVIDNGQALIFDTPAYDADAKALMEFVNKKLNCDVKGVVINHFHDDCLGSLKTFHAAGIPSYGSDKTVALARSAGVEVPQNGFDQNSRLIVGSISVENAYPGKAHTSDNIVSYVPADKVLFGGCMVKAMDANKGYLGDASVADWPATIQRVKVIFPDIEVVIPGHGDVGGTDLLDYTITLFQ